MKIIDRYIFKELFLSFFLGFIVFTFILLLNSIFQLVDIFVSKNVSILRLIQMLLYLSLTLVTLTVPISILFSIIMTYSKFSQNNEITIMRSSGIKTLFFIWQPLLISIILTGILFYMNAFQIPKIQQSFQNIYKAVLQKKSAVKFDDRTFVQIENYRIYVNKVDKKKDLLLGVTIYNFSTDRTTRIIAQKGRAENIEGKGLVLTLYDGILQNTPLDDMEKFTQFAFKIYRITVPMYEQGQVTKSKTLREYSIKEIKEEILNYRKKNIPTNYLETEYYLRYVLSTAGFFFCILAIPLGITLHKSSKSIGTGVTILVVTVYYFLLIGSIIISERGLVPAKYIMWSSNFIMFIPALFFNIRMFKK